MEWCWCFFFRCDHSCAVVDLSMFVCAGTGSDELWFNDLHRFSVDSLEWREVEQKGHPPSPRDYSTLVAVNDWVSWSWSNISWWHPSTLQYLVMYGGSSAMGGSEECFSDLHYIDITSGEPLLEQFYRERSRNMDYNYSVHVIQPQLLRFAWFALCTSSIMYGVSLFCRVFRKSWMVCSQSWGRTAPPSKI